MTDFEDDNVTPITEAKPAGQKLGADMAEQEFNRFVDVMDLDVSTVGFSDEDMASFDKQKKRIINALCVGSLIINEDGEPIFTPVKDDNKEPVHFYEPTGASLMAMDGEKKNHDVKKTFKVMANMTKKTPMRFANMPNRDLNVCQAIFTIFLA